MGQVLLGALLGALVGYGLGSWPDFGSTQVMMATSDNRRININLAPLMRSLCVVIGIATGAIVGAIAGSTAARGESEENTPFSTRQVLLILLIAGVVVALGILAIVLFVQFIPDEEPKPEQRDLKSKPANVSIGETSHELSERTVLFFTLQT